MISNQFASDLTEEENEASKESQILIDPNLRYHK